MDEISYFDKFSDQAKDVLIRAQREAEKRGARRIRTEHLLLALLERSQSVSANILGSFGVSPDRIRLTTAFESTKEKGAQKGKPGLSEKTQEALTNALNFAAQFQHEMVGTLSVGVKELTARSFKDEIKKIKVGDTGVGIPQENLDKVLEPFFSTKPVGRGTGLGLSLCFSIIEAHGGRLEIRSQPGKGTEVEVILPIDVSRKEQRNAEKNPRCGRR